MKRVLPLILLATPALADVPEVVQNVALPGYEAFATATQTLADKAGETCDPTALAPAYGAAWDAWLAVQWLHMGPAEEHGRALAISFWPDPKALGLKAQNALLGGDPALLEPKSFADQSVAARGLFGLERLLTPATPWDSDPCPLIRATTADLTRMAKEISEGWNAGFGDQLLTAGAEGNTRFLSPQEAKQALFTQIATGLEFVKDSRIGRPLGTFDKPRPELAEARASARSQRNVLLSLQALRAATAALAPEATKTLAAFDHTITLAGTLDDPDFATIKDPGPWLKLQIVQQNIGFTRDLLLSEVAGQLGVDLGFNAADGD